ncbi:hypothetical protein COL940_009770 [Colletotrichum noveboracense]|nr:hypothetical protein COL940_009770 [Colletotrichum noveboracense]KAJ0279598.1 hypothetical protein CBS470a_009210 [Colletotrichum nupharicola]
MNPDESPQLQQRTTSNAEGIHETKSSAAQLENIEEADLRKFKLSESGGDVALALFDNVGGIHDPIDPKEDRKLVRKVDWMILPYISVCYAFFYDESMWYTRREQPIKIGLWYTANGVGIALGGLLGYGIGNIKGALASWKYEFIIVGALCCAWGMVIAVFLPDNPITSKALSQREKKIVIERLRENQTGVENKTLKLYQVREAFTDFKLYFFFMIALLQAISLLVITAVLQIPYGVLIFIAILVYVFINDGLPPNNRCFMLVLFLLPNVVGAFGLRFVPDDQQVGRLICYYVSSYQSSMPSGVSRSKKRIVIFQLTGSINASFVLLLSLQTANIAGHTKKVVTSACLFLGYCVGNIAGPFFYKSDQAAKYELGIWSMIVAHLLEVVIVIALRFVLKWENEWLDRAQGEVAEVDLDATAFGDLTDQENMNFRYIY